MYKGRDSYSNDIDVDCIKHFEFGLGDNSVKIINEDEVDVLITVWATIAGRKLYRGLYLNPSIMVC